MKTKQTTNETRSETMFTQETTQGYTDAELDTLNAEWNAFAGFHNLMPGTDEYDHEEKRFADEVSKR